MHLCPTLVLLCAAATLAKAPSRLQLDPGDHVVIVGNTFAERLQEFGHFETLLHSRFPEHKLVVRNLGWSADELTLRPRQFRFADHGHRLVDHKPDVVLACFGFNESFAGPDGLAKFKEDLAEFIRQTTTTKYNGRTAPTLVLLSPIAHEDLGRPGLPDGKANNRNLALYTAAMKKVAAAHGVLCVDLFAPSQKLMAPPKSDLTINGVHLNGEGYRRLAPILDVALFGPRKGSLSANHYERLRAAVNEKNRQFFYDHRTVNGLYVFGQRKSPFGVVNFPAEFARLRKMIAVRDRRIWDIAQGKPVPETIDDANTGELPDIPSNYDEKIAYKTPVESQKEFRLADGYAVNLFASEVEFPELANPVQIAFDARGRLWVCTMPTYPMYRPGTPPRDKLLILEDTDGDGRADKRTVFADGLYLPTGFELSGDGGVYVAQPPNLVFLADTDGDDRADVRRTVLHGFGTADSHHAISTFTWGPGGGLYFQEGTFLHTQVETPYGPRRVKNAGVFRYEPRSEKLDVFISYAFSNPWGHVFDRWGQSFIADASGGHNYYATPLSVDIDYPHKHGRLRRLFPVQWRPTAGCAIVSSRNFLPEDQGKYLLANCIGLRGVLKYTFSDDGSGFVADPDGTLLRSGDENFRPVDLKFGPDGALYVVDWHNALVGHFQHSLRDPNRDVTHGRIWRVTCAERPLVEPPPIEGATIPELLDVLKTYEDRTRYRARRTLRSRKTKQVLAALDRWITALDKSDEDYEHHLLEALWLKQSHGAIDEAFLKARLRSPEPRARAAATRVLCFWRDRIEEPLELLKTQVRDDHPRVRLEAVRALSFFNSSEALEIALDSLNQPQDDDLKYVLRETVATLERRIEKNE